VAGCQRNKLFTLIDKKWVGHHNEAANTMLHHGCKSRLKTAFGAGGQHLQVFLKSIDCCPNLGLVSFDIHIAGICEQCDRVGGRQKLVQQLHALRSQDTEKYAHTSKVSRGSTEIVDEPHLDRICASYEDNGNRFGCCLCGKRRWEVAGKNRSHIPAHQFGRKGR
jgi:hypothetical protein